MTDWKARAEREAAAIIAEGVPSRPLADRLNNVPLAVTYQDLVSLVALGWLQGANYGDHARLTLIEDAFDELRASL